MKQLQTINSIYFSLLIVGGFSFSFWSFYSIFLICTVGRSVCERSPVLGNGHHFFVIFNKLWWKQNILLCSSHLPPAFLKTDIYHKRAVSSKSCLRAKNGGLWGMTAPIVVVYFVLYFYEKAAFGHRLGIDCLGHNSLNMLKKDLRVLRSRITYKPIALVHNMNRIRKKFTTKILRIKRKKAAKETKPRFDLGQHIMMSRKLFADTFIRINGDIVWRLSATVIREKVTHVKVYMLWV